MFYKLLSNKSYLYLNIYVSYLIFLFSRVAYLLPGGKILVLICVKFESTFIAIFSQFYKLKILKPIYCNKLMEFWNESDFFIASYDPMHEFNLLLAEFLFRCSQVGVLRS